MASIERLSRRFVLAVTLVFPIVSTVSAQDEVSLTKLSSSAIAGHTIIVTAIGGTGNETDTTEAYASGTSEATATTMPIQLHAGVTAWDPHAAAVGYGYNTALAGLGHSRITSGLCYRYLWVEAEPLPPAYAECMMTHDASGEAYWKIPLSETGNTWIQAEIQIAGPGAWNPPDGEIVTELGCLGVVQVADTVLYYEIENDAGIHVHGTLMDLDGPHTIDTTYPGPVVNLITRQYIAPGVEFVTLTVHRAYTVPSGRDIYTANDVYVAGGIVGTTWAKSTHLEAFVGSP